jgi:LysR family transcriptional activator of glutamate synthase operon
MNFNQLRYFVAIVKHGSFWSAALEEYISQSSLSKQIKALETELGVVLFNRTGNKITLASVFMIMRCSCWRQKTKCTRS